MTRKGLFSLSFSLPKTRVYVILGTLEISKYGITFPDVNGLLEHELVALCERLLGRSKELHTAAAASFPTPSCALHSTEGSDHLTTVAPGSVFLGGGGAVGGGTITNVT